MTHTLDSLLTALGGLDPAAPASFTGPGGETQGAWHVTRLTLSRRTHLDCDGTESTDREAVIELLDGPLGAAMTMRRLAAILMRGRDGLPGSGAVPLRVLHRSVRHSVEAVEAAGIRMDPVPAACRPAARSPCCA